MRSDGLHGGGVRGRGDAVNDDVTVQRLRVVEALGGNGFDGFDGRGRAVAEAKAVAGADGRGRGKRAVDVKVVAGREGERGHRRVQPEEGARDVAEAVREHEDGGEGARVDADGVADAERFHGDSAPIGELDGRVGREARLGGLCRGLGVGLRFGLGVLGDFRAVDAGRPVLELGHHDDVLELGYELRLDVLDGERGAEGTYEKGGGERFKLGTAAEARGSLEADIVLLAVLVQGKLNVDIDADRLEHAHELLGHLVVHGVQIGEHSVWIHNELAVCAITAIAIVLDGIMRHGDDVALALFPGSMRNDARAHVGLITDKLPLGGHIARKRPPDHWRNRQPRVGDRGDRGDRGQHENSKGGSGVHGAIGGNGCGNRACCGGQGWG